MFNYEEYIKSKYLIKKKRILESSKYLKMLAKLENNLLEIIMNISNTEKNYEELSEEENEIVARKKVELYLEFSSLYREKFLKKFREGIKERNETAELLINLKKK